MAKGLKQVWKNRKHILEGLKNNIFKQEHIEKIAEERISICITDKCKSYDITGKGCIASGTQPCCDERNGGCGCSLSLATRSLAKECPKGYWEAILSEDENDKLENLINKSNGEKL